MDNLNGFTVDAPVAFAELIETLKRIGDPPCKGCPHFERCGTEPAACGDFVHWAETSEIRDEQRAPSQDLFDYVHGYAPFHYHLRPRVRAGVLDALLFEARTAENTVTLAKSLREGERNITAYGRMLRREGVSIAGGAMRVLLQRTRGPVPSIQALDYILERKT